MRNQLALLSCLFGLAALAACASDSQNRRQVSDPAVPPPLQLSTSAYQAAAVVELPTVAALELPGLHHVYRLSDQIISGAEPVGVEAFEQLREMGVHTILSVDGKVPDHETAAQYGIRYVHVPIQYSGIDDDELARIAKTFRELDGPFYVHCFHGKHRGPAAAAVGRVVLDGVPRDQAIAEMRQWCSTSPKYEGLYKTIATTNLPSTATTKQFAFDFEPAHQFTGIRHGMIAMPRTWDRIKDLKKADWQVDPAHPDIVPLQEAVQLHQIYADLIALDEMKAHADDFRGWMEQGLRGSERLQRALSACSQDEDSFATGDWRAEAAEAYELIADSCSSCHAVYRD
ncbi:MAG: hypothetical protein H6831_05985 [Planctomycetes bacterium]|nr:hypothetical protein [Planctomycetota bacterium]MCB9903941.1 hypothetical protein [Planctomycetota bacterium]